MPLGREGRGERRSEEVSEYRRETVGSRGRRRRRRKKQNKSRKTRRRIRKKGGMREEKDGKKK